jgi:hypothetical protein
LLVGRVATFVTWPASLRPLRASTVTVAVCPTFTFPTSDSLSGTTSSIEPRSLSTANEELEELDDEPEELEAPAAAPAEPPGELADDPPPEELLLPALLLDALVVPVADTVSPTSPDSAAIVPLSGA